jgi:hypothetical protein
MIAAKMKTQSNPFFSELEPVRRRLDQWRRTRRHRERIPEALWAVMSRLARRHGVSRSARALGVGYYDLKQRVAMPSPSPQTTSERCQFVEVSLPVAAPSAQCVVELEDPNGIRMVMRLPGATAAEAAALVEAFRRSQP